MIGCCRALNVRFVTAGYRARTHAKLAGGGSGDKNTIGNLEITGRIRGRNVGAVTAGRGSGNATKIVSVESVGDGSQPFSGCHFTIATRARAGTNGDA